MPLFVISCCSDLLSTSTFVEEEQEENIKVIIIHIIKGAMLHNKMLGLCIIIYFGVTNRTEICNAN